MDDKMPDPDDGLELNEEIVKRLRRSLEKPPESFLSPEEMYEHLKISPLTFHCAICGVGFKRLDHMVQCAESHRGVPSRGKTQLVVKHIYKEPTALSADPLTSAPQP